MQLEKLAKLGVTMLLLSVGAVMHGQSTPPEWFTYPKQGEYVGVSVKMENRVGLDCEIKSAIMSALVSYALQNESSMVAYENVAKLYSDGKSTNNQSLKTLLFSCVMGFDLMRLEKNEDERVWVSIKPTDKEKAHSYVYFTLSLDGYDGFCMKNDTIDSYDKHFKMSCSYKTFNDSVQVVSDWAIRKMSLSDGSVRFVFQDDPSPFPVQTFAYGIKANDSWGNAEEKDTLIEEPSDEPWEWMMKQAAAKGYKGISPNCASLSDKGSSYLSALLETLMKSELYVINPETKQVERKKATRTYATFFHEGECFIFNDVMGE